jgi:hypothetical protein
MLVQSHRLDGRRLSERTIDVDSHLAAACEPGDGLRTALTVILTMGMPMTVGPTGISPLYTPSRMIQHDTPIRPVRIGSVSLRPCPAREPVLRILRIHLGRMQTLPFALLSLMLVYCMFQPPAHIHLTCRPTAVPVPLSEPSPRICALIRGIERLVRV